MSAYWYCSFLGILWMTLGLDHMCTWVYGRMEKMYSWGAVEKLNMEYPRSGKSSWLEYWLIFLQYWHLQHQFQIGKGSPMCVCVWWLDWDFHEHLDFLFFCCVPSYDRIQPNSWSGAYLCWGMENREAPLRAACPPGIPHGSVSNFEIKVFDGCANPYLGLASIVAAGIDGLRTHLTLPQPMGNNFLYVSDLPLVLNNWQLSSLPDDNPDNAKHKVQRLPKSLSESVEALEKDTVLRDLLGEKLLRAVSGVRKVLSTHLHYIFLFL